MLRSIGNVCVYFIVGKKEPGTVIADLERNDLTNTIIIDATNAPWLPEKQQAQVIDTYDK